MNLLFNASTAAKSLAQKVKMAALLVQHGMSPYLVGIEKFIAILLGRRVPVRPAPHAATSGDVIYLPPQELDEKGNLIYMGKALHETAHILIGSDFDHFKSIQKTHKHGALIARLINITDDIRVENGFQRKYPRVVETTRPYWQWKEQEVLPDIDEPQILMTDLVTLVLNVGVLFIARCRFRQLGLTMTYQPNPLVSRVYDDYFADLESEAIAQVAYQDSVNLAFKLYERIKDMIRDDIQPPAPPQQGEDEQDDDQQGQPGQPCNNPNAKDDADDDNKQDSDDQEDSDGDSGQSGDEDDDSQQDEGGSGESSDDEQDDSGDEKSSGQSSSSDEDGDDASSSGSDSDGSDEDADSDGEEDSSGDDESGDDTDESDEGEDAGDASDDESDDADSEDEQGQDDSGESEDDSEDGDEQGTGSQDDSEDESDTDSDGDGEDDSDDSDDESGEESEDGSEEDEGEAGEDEEQETPEEKINRQVEEQLDGVDLDADQIKTPDNIVTDNLNKVEDKDDFEYLPHPNVKDDIRDGWEGADTTAQLIKSEGIALLGKAGRDMVRHFISQTKPRIIRRQDAGRFDTQTFLKDRYRQDVYNFKMKGALEKAALAIALDNSQSMTWYGNRAYTASQLLAGLLHHTDKNDIPTLAAGYTMGKYATMPESDLHRFYPVRIDVIKRFEERVNAQVLRRCCPLPDSYRSGTPDLDCLKWLTPQLWERPEEKKVMFVICDGEPTAAGDELSRRLKVSYKRYIEACKLAGIKIFGFGIQADISEYFGDDWAYVTPSSLADTFIERLRIILNQK